MAGFCNCEMDCLTSDEKRAGKKNDKKLQFYERDYVVVCDSRHCLGVGVGGDNNLRSNVEDVISRQAYFFLLPFFAFPEATPPAFRLVPAFSAAAEPPASISTLGSWRGAFLTFSLSGSHKNKENPAFIPT